jgi:hypothetical protein
MFGIWKRKKTEVHKHWYTVLMDFETTTSEFYQAVEETISSRELTGLEISRIEYAEGGVLSAKRQYLRMRRERLVFDVCSAAFGKTWFFSCRFAEIPVEIRLWEVLVLLTALALVEAFYANLFGLILGSILFAASLLSLLLLMRNTLAVGLEDLDAGLIQIPVIGAFYERFLRKETYYREDTRLAYIDIVDKIVREKVDEFTAAKGVKLVDYKDATPPSHPGILKMVGSLLQLGR